MSDDSTTGTQDRPLGQRVKHGFESKVVVPLAITIVSAATSYLLKKLPLILEEKVLPKLREQGAPDKVTNVVEQAAGVVGGSGSGSAEAEESGNGAAPKQPAPSKAAKKDSDGGAASMTAKEREEERRKRDERRQARKGTSKKAA